MSNHYILEKESIVRLILNAAELLRVCATRLLEPFDLTMEQAWVLSHLKNNDTLSQKVLSEMAAKDQANITRILKRLLKKGLIERKSNISDKRVKLVMITAKGDELLDNILGKISNTAELLSAFSDEERQTLQSLLIRYTKFAEEIKKYWKF